MKKIVIIIVSMVFLIPGLMMSKVYGEDQSTKLYYEVKATVIYKDFDGNQTIQKVSVGEELKEPQALVKEHYRFIGWKDQETGLYWNFNDPVTKHMELIAIYEKIEDVDTSAKDLRGYYYLLMISFAGVVFFRKRKLDNGR